MGDTQDSLFKSENPKFIMDYKGILETLPHRYPFLLVDGIVSLEKGKLIIGQKNVSFNEPYFTGHFPGEPVMPGVMQIEALAQLSCLMILLSFPEDCVGKRPAFGGMDEVRFRKPVRPGHVLILKSELLKYRRGFGIARTTAEIDGDVACEAIIKASMF